MMPAWKGAMPASLFHPEAPSESVKSTASPAVDAMPQSRAGLRQAVRAIPVSGPLPGRKLTLAILLVVFAVNFMDRQILAILLEPIKRDLDLSDA